MKIISVILISLWLSGCVNTRDAQINMMLYEHAAEEFRLKSKLDMYTEEENLTRPLTVRDYKQEDGTILRIALPSDCFLSSELESRFRYLKNTQVVVSDNNYWLPSKYYVYYKLLPAFRKVNTMSYSTKYDCDDFSKYFSYFAQLYYSDTVLTKPMEAISVCEIYYKKTDSKKSFAITLPLQIKVSITISDKHAINGIIVEGSGFMFIEPQTGTEVTLTTEEINSIYFCRF